MADYLNIKYGGYAVYSNFKYGGHRAEFKFKDGGIYEYGGIFKITTWRFI
jgi:hypothetical protein